MRTELIMKKIIAVMLLAVSILTLVSCAGKKCDKCGQKITGEAFEEAGLGEGKKIYCESCYNEAKDYISGLSGLLGDMFS